MDPTRRVRSSGSTPSEESALDLEKTSYSRSNTNNNPPSFNQATLQTYASAGQSPINSLIGKKVMKVGRSSGLTKGTVLAYALEYNDEKGICFFTDFLVVGENQQTFDLEGDSGSLIVMKGENV
ncbi:protein NARROW LEAF 1, partial [Tanacetum coccineum]